MAWEALSPSLGPPARHARWLRSSCCAICDFCNLSLAGRISMRFFAYRSLCCGELAEWVPRACCVFYNFYNVVACFAIFNLMQLFISLLSLNALFKI